MSVKRLGGSRAAPAPAQRAKPAKHTHIGDDEAAGLKLPTAKSNPPTEISAYRLFIYGEGGVGKTSLVARFADTLFFTWELASTGLSLYRTELLTTWDKAMEYVRQLRTTKHKYHAVCFDTGAPAYERCMEYVGRQHGFDHPGGQNDFGKSWKLVNDEFRRIQTEIAGLGLALTVVSHDKLVEINTRSGESVWRVEPNMGGKCLQYYRENSDVIGYYYMHGRERFLQIIGDDFVLAKANPERHFRTPKGERIHRIPMGTSPDDAYAALMRAFGNKQTETYADMSSRDATDESARRVRRRHSNKTKGKG